MQTDTPHDPSISFVAKIIDWSVANKFFVMLGSLVLLAAGIIAVQKMPLDAIPGDLSDKVRQFGGVPMEVMDSLFLYAADGKALWQQIGEWGLPQHACFLRRSTLEDVFLKLTGRGTEE